MAIELLNRLTENPARATREVKNGGTTTDAYAAALDVDVTNLKEKTIVLSNTHGTNGLTYKVEVAAVKGQQLYTLVSDTALAAGEKSLIQYQRAYGQIKVSVKATVGGSQATFDADFIGQTL